MKYNFINNFKREPLVTAGLIAAGASLAGQGANAYMTGKTNLKTRQFAEEMYARQRRDALADWNAQNAYNSPEAQMGRFKAAGLNPHLIYGQMSEGATIRSTDSQPWHSEAPKVDFGEAAGKYFDVKQQQVVEQGQRKAQEVMDAEIELKRAQTIFQNVQSETGSFDLNLKKVLRDNNISLAQSSLEAKQWDVSKQQQEYQFARMNQSMKLQQNDLDAAIKTQSVVKGAEEILTLQKGRAKTDAEIAQINEQIQNLKRDGAVKELDAQLAEKKIRPGDPLWQRQLMLLLQSIKEKSLEYKKR